MIHEQINISVQDWNETQDAIEHAAAVLQDLRTQADSAARHAKGAPRNALLTTVDRIDAALYKLRKVQIPF